MLKSKRQIKIQNKFTIVRFMSFLRKQESRNSLTLENIEKRESIFLTLRCGLRSNNEPKK